MIRVPDDYSVLHLEEGQYTSDSVLDGLELLSIDEIHEDDVGRNKPHWVGNQKKLNPQIVQTDPDRRLREFSPEARLKLAVLSDAIWCYQRPVTRRDGKPNRANALTVEEARVWFDAEDPSEPGFSFEDVCHVLDLDPGRVWARVKAMTHGAPEERRRFDYRELMSWIR